MSPGWLRVGLALLMSASTATSVDAGPRKVLLVTLTTGYRHSSIATAERVIAQIGERSGHFVVELASVEPPPEPAPDAGAAQQAGYQTARRAYGDAVRAELASKMSAEALKRYDAVVFANTTGELPLPDPAAFIQWVRDGGAFVGVHSASDTLHGYRPYIEMLGGEFDYHREQVRVEALNQAPTHPATGHLGPTWTLAGRAEEIYVFKNHRREAVRSLVALDRHPNERSPGHYGISWCHAFGRGRVFYTALGHNESIWALPAFQQHLRGGIEWALRLREDAAVPR